MKASNYIKAHLAAGLIFVILVTHLPVIYTLLYHNLTGAPTANAGNIDCANISATQPAVLDGSWEFYWNRLIVSEPRQADKPDFLIAVPDYWSKYKIGGSWLPADGFASYRLMLKGLNAPRPVTAFIPDFGSAYRVFIDGTLAAESGTVSKDTAKVFTVPQAKLYPVTLLPGDHTVVIEVATTRFSGLYMAPRLQDYNRAMEESTGRDNLRFFLFGIVLFSLFALAVIFLLSIRKKLRLVWLPAIIACLLLRIMLTTEFYSFWQKAVFFNLSYESTNALMFLATFVLKFLLIFLIQDQFEIPFSRKEKTVFFTYYTVIYLLYMFIPHGIYNRHLTIVLPVSSFALEVYAFIKVFFGKKTLKKFGIPVYWGVNMAIAGLIIDSYYINGNIYPNLSLALLFSLMAYLVIVSLVYALRTVAVYHDLAISSSRLAMAKNQIAMQTEYYDALSAKINEVRAIKHDMRHFTGVIRQFAAEGRMEELTRFLSDYTERTDTEPLPVFCENIVANSILGYYAIKAKNSGILFRCACAIPKRLAVSDGDLCVVLGNALENAFEACEKLDDPKARSVSAEAGIIKGQMLIKIENSYNGCLRVKSGGYLSTKAGEFHGLGLQNIQKVAEANGGFVKTEHTGGVFTLMAAFPHPDAAK